MDYIETITPVIAQIIGGVQLLKKLGVPTKYLDIVTAVISFTVAYFLTQDLGETMTLGLVIAAGTVGIYKIAGKTGDVITEESKPRPTLRERYPLKDIEEQIKEELKK